MDKNNTNNTTKENEKTSNEQGGTLRSEAQKTQEKANEEKGQPHAVKQTPTTSQQVGHEGDTPNVVKPQGEVTEHKHGVGQPKTVIERGSTTEEVIVPKDVESKSPKQRGDKVILADEVEPHDKVATVEEELRPSLENTPSGFTKIISADGRTLEASVGDQHWIGKELDVPNEQAGEVRRLLEEGGFYLKN